MEIKHELQFGNKKVRIDLSSLIQNGNHFEFQYGKGSSELQNYGSLKIENNKLIINSDVFSGHRIYYWEKGDDVFITDDVLKFIPESELKALEISEFENIFFSKHGYTSGDATRYKMIKKLPPSSMMIVNENGISLNSTWSFGNIKNAPNRFDYENAIHESVARSLIPLKTLGRPVVLCFSGGKDSTYIALILKELEIKHELAFFQVRNSKTNERELKKAKAQAMRLGIVLNVYDITDSFNPEIEEGIRRFNIFDNHYCRVQFYGCKELRHKYGDDLIIINGQNSDSILTYGPSESKFSSKVKRYLLHGDSMWLKKLCAFIIGSMFRKRLRVPRNRSERLSAFYDNFKYCLLLDKRSNRYSITMSEKIDAISKFIQVNDSENNLMMYLKVFTHMQGSDAQVVTQSCRGEGDLIMPFSTKDIIKAALQFKDNETETKHPKYALDRICKRLLR